MPFYLGAVNCRCALDDIDGDNDGGYKDEERLDEERADEGEAA